MNIKVFNDNVELSREVIRELRALKDGSNILIPSGSTPRDLYEKLGREIFATKLNYFALDEWLEIDINNPGSSYSMIKSDFLDKSELDLKLHYFLPEDSLFTSKKKYKDLLDGSEFDYSILGIGRNGHIGLNEPGIHYDEDYIISELDKLTVEVANKKYFKEKTLITKGITIGIQKILKSKKIVIIVNTKDKSEILKEVIFGEDNSIPSTYMKKYENVYFYVTKDVLGGI